MGRPPSSPGATFSVAVVAVFDASVIDVGADGRTAGKKMVLSPLVPVPSVLMARIRMKYPVPRVSPVIVVVVLVDVPSLKVVQMVPLVECSMV